MAFAAGVGLVALMMLIPRAMHPPAGIDAFLVTGLGLSMGRVPSPVLRAAKSGPPSDMPSLSTRVRLQLSHLQNEMRRKMEHEDAAKQIQS